MEAVCLYICVCVYINIYIYIHDLRFVRGQACNIASLGARNSAGGKQGGWNSFVGSKNVAGAPVEGLDFGAWKSDPRFNPVPSFEGGAILAFTSGFVRGDSRKETGGSFSLSFLVSFRSLAILPFLDS